MRTETLAGKTVFIVEDNSANLSVAATVLREVGATVIFDTLGLNTAEQLQQFPHIDIVLLDLSLHGRASGFDVYDQIKAHPEIAHIPIVAVSAMDPSIGMSETRKRGFNGFIGKPIDSEQFPEQIAAVLGGAQVWYAP